MFTGFGFQRSRFKPEKLQDSEVPTSKKSAGNFLNTIWSRLSAEGGCQCMDRACMSDRVSVKNNRHYADTGTYNIRRKNLAIVTTIEKWQGRDSMN